MAAKDVEPVDRMTRWHDFAPIEFRVHDSLGEQRVIANLYSVKRADTVASRSTAKKPTQDLCDTYQLRGHPDRVVTLAVSNLGHPSVCANNRRRGLTSCVAGLMGLRCHRASIRRYSFGDSSKSTLPTLSSTVRGSVRLAAPAAWCPFIGDVEGSFHGARGWCDDRRRLARGKCSDFTVELRDDGVRA